MNSQIIGSNNSDSNSNNNNNGLVIDTYGDKGLHNSIIKHSCH